MSKSPKVTAIALLCAICVHAQNSIESIYTSFVSQSFLQQNSFMLNPTFSVVLSNDMSVALLSRNNISGFNNSPSFNLISYSGKNSEQIGTGIGVFQEHRGVFTRFGAVANYAHQIQLSENSTIALGFNFVYSKSDIDRSKVISTQSDPLINNFIPSLNLVLQPAVSFSFKNFNIGIFAKDIVDYDVNSKKFTNNFSDKTIAGHVLYKHEFQSNTRLLSDSSLTSLFSFSNSINSKFTGSLLFDIPKIGWLQAGYDDFFGFSSGIGFNISEKLSISYVFEKGKVPVGNVNEVGIIYHFKKREKTIHKNYRTPIITEFSQDLTTQKIKINERNEVKPIQEKKEIIETIKKDSDDHPEIAILEKTADLQEGFYLIVNVFSMKDYADRFIKKLRKDGLKPKFFIHPITKNRYVYLFKSEHKEEVVEKYKNNMQGKYNHEKWILKIK